MARDDARGGHGRTTRSGRQAGEEGQPRRIDQAATTTDIVGDHAVKCRLPPSASRDVPSRRSPRPTSRPPPAPATRAPRRTRAPSPTQPPPPRGVPAAHAPRAAGRRPRAPPPVDGRRACARGRAGAGRAGAVAGRRGAARGAAANSDTTRGYVGGRARGGGGQRGCARGARRAQLFRGRRRGRGGARRGGQPQRRSRRRRAPQGTRDGQGSNSTPHRGIPSQTARLNVRVQFVLVSRDPFTREYGSRVSHSSPCRSLFVHMWRVTIESSFFVARHILS